MADKNCSNSAPATKSGNLSPHVQHLFTRLSVTRDNCRDHLRGCLVPPLEEMESSPKTFLFVNKTQTSRVLSRSEGAERIHVQSHSQRARRLRENKTATIFHESWSVTTPAENRLDLRQRKPRPSRASSSTRRSISTTSTKAGLSVANSKSEDNQNGENLRRNQCPSGNCLDPFDSTVAGNDIVHYHHAIMGFVYGKTPKVAFFAEAFAPPMQLFDPSPMRHDAAISNRLQHCIQDRGLMYSTLAYGTNLLGWMEAAAESFKSAEYFTAQAIQAVRERLASPPNSLAMSYRKADSRLAMSIYSLAISELWKAIPLMRHRNTDHTAPFELRQHIKKPLQHGCTFMLFSNWLTAPVDGVQMIRTFSSPPFWRTNTWLAGNRRPPS